MAGMEIKGRRVLVTGGTSGVGRALAAELTERGARVVVCGRTAAGEGQVAADLAVAGQAERLVREAAERLGGLDLVVANAGVQHHERLTAGVTPGLLERTEQEVAVNLRSVAELAAAAWPWLAASPEAAFVAVTSGLAYAPKRSAPLYCATKAGVHVLCEALRYQARADTPHVRVQEVVLPLVDTPMTAGRSGPVRKLSPEAAARSIARGVERGSAVLPVGASRALLVLLRLCPPLARRLLRDG